MSKKNPVFTGLLFAALLLPEVSANYLNTGGQRGLGRTVVTKTLGTTGYSTGMTLGYGWDRKYMRGIKGVRRPVDLLTGDTLTTGLGILRSINFYFAYGVVKDWDISASLPIFQDITGWGSDNTDIGNLEIISKFTYPTQERDLIFSQAYYLRVVLPTGGRGFAYFPRHTYYVWDKTYVDEYWPQVWAVNPMLVWTIYGNRLFFPMPFKVHGNLGGLVGSSGSFIGAAGIESLTYGPLTFFLELTGESLIEYYLDNFKIGSFDNDGLFLTPGLKAEFKSGLAAGFAIDFGLSDPDIRSEWGEGGHEYSTKALPAWNFQFTLEWNGIFREQDYDGDGILNNKDLCPTEKEDIDNFEDGDGCADPDNDNDGIPDVKDKCPYIPVVCDGCPVEDYDKDGLFGDEDKCPFKPEDLDGFDDEDGCPDPDNDHDGIADKDDKCPGKPEDTDQFQDQDGCPDSDNDDDGIPDKLDHCPDKQGPTDTKGCPKGDEKREWKGMFK
ncbi:thrombospondin type 3 repeat-containing protein [Fibrobacterota bacterium]